MTIQIDETKLERVGENVKFVEIDGKLILVIDLKNTIGLSKTGKMMGIGSTGGFVRLPHEMSLNLYMGKKHNG